MKYMRCHRLSLFFVALHALQISNCMTCHRICLICFTTSLCFHHTVLFCCVDWVLALFAPFGWCFIGQTQARSMPGLCSHCCSLAVGYHINVLQLLLTFARVFVLFFMRVVCLSFPGSWIVCLLLPLFCLCVPIAHVPISTSI